ncbi:MAG: DNA repair protein RadC [Clostridia bacterium]|nr:DNA repair protein RadC [Clostridia bacterium]
MASKNPGTNTNNKKGTEKNIHEGHRERIRQRFLKEGLDSFQPHNVLELLLFYCIPIKDTNKVAHSLINHFGSLSSVFDASFEDLCKVNGIGEKSATLIKLMPELFRKYEVDKVNNEDAVLNTCELVAGYVSKYFKGVTEERLYLLCLDSAFRVLCFEQISTGTVNVAPVNNRKIVELAYRYNASNIILVHNHPSGVVAPSKADVNATVSMIELFKSLGIKLNDHMIIGNGEDFFSFRRSGKWKGLF